MVTVSSATSTKPTVFPMMQCDSGAGNTVTLGCLATGFTPSALTYAWTKDGAALTDFTQYPPMQRDNAYTGVSQIRVNKQDWEAKHKYKCTVTHAAGNGEANFVQREVRYVLPTLSMWDSGDDTEHSFACFAKHFSPKQHEIKWLKNEMDVTNKISEIITPTIDEKDENGTLYSTASFLRVPASEWMDGTTFKCVFKGKIKAGPKSVNASIQFEPKSSSNGFCETAAVDVKITGPTMEDMFLNQVGTLLCHVKINKPSVDEIRWEDDEGNPMANDFVKPVKGRKEYSLPHKITFDEWSQGIKRVCVVVHDEIHLPIKETYERMGEKTKRPSVFMMPPVEHTREKKVTLTCYVRNFSPKEVFVSWLVDDDKCNSTYESHTTDIVGTGGSYSAYGQLSLSLDQWQSIDTQYSCQVHHESVANTTKAIVRSIGYRTFERTNLVNLNLSVPETCKAQCKAQ